MTDATSEPLDLRGLKCPLPALLTRRALGRVAMGAEITVIADDPLAAVDIPHMCHHQAHDVLAVTREGDVTRLRLRRGA